MTMDVVYNLLHEKKFCQYSNEEKHDLKNKGRPLPDIIIEATGVSRGKAYKRQFNREIYSRNDWICGCNKKHALFCFPCLLFGGDKAWTKVGVRDVVHLNDKMKRHENSRSHLYNTMELALLGKINVRAQLNSDYWVNVQKQNDSVTKNRHVLSKIINCIKLCGAFELAQRGHDDMTDISQNSGIFHGLINFAAELDTTLSEHLKNTSVFKGIFPELQNDLLDCILEVCHEEIIKEINKSSFLAVMVDEIADASGKTQLAVILRYTLNGEPIERFWKYLTLTKCDVETLSNNILNVIDSLVENSPYKLISQSYDGTTIMSEGVQVKVRQKYPCAHFVHCYTHQFNLIISKAASLNSQVRVFFGNLKEIPSFFNNSPEHVEVLNRVVGRKNPQSATNCWNFNISTVNLVFENIDSFIECMEEIEEQFNNETVCSAASFIRRMLEDSDFVFWLTFFHHLMPHVDVLFNELQKEMTDPIQIENAVDNFVKSIIHIQNTIDDIISKASVNVFLEPQEKKVKRAHNSEFSYRAAALEVCDNIMNSTYDRFMFKGHLQAVSLFFSEHFGEYYSKFPEEKLTQTCLAYPILEKERLRTELSVIYLRNDCSNLNGVLPLLKFLTHNNLGQTLRETKKLLEIVATTPMLTSEAERCFSTSKRIKTFLRNSMSQDRLTALSMLSIEKLFISKIDNFNEKVIDKFASMKDRGVELTFKKQLQEYYQNSQEERRCGAGGDIESSDVSSESTIYNVGDNTENKNGEESNYEYFRTNLDDHPFMAKGNRRKRNLIKWNDEEKQAIEFFFHKHIEQRIFPKKQEVLQLMKLYPNLFRGQKWDVIKVYVCNKYNSERKVDHSSVPIESIKVEGDGVPFVSVQSKQNDHISPFLQMDIKEERTRLVENTDLRSLLTVKIEEKRKPAIDVDPLFERCMQEEVEIKIKEEPSNDGEFGLEMDMEETENDSINEQEKVHHNKLFVTQEEEDEIKKVTVDLYLDSQNSNTCAVKAADSTVEIKESPS